MGNQQEKPTQPIVKQQQQQQHQQQQQQSKKSNEVQNQYQIAYTKTFNTYQSENKINVSHIPIENQQLAIQFKQFVQSIFKTDTLSLQQYLDLCDILTKAPDYNVKYLNKMRPVELMFKFMGYSENDSIANEVCLSVLNILFTMIKSGQAAKYLMNRIYDDSLDSNQRVGYVCNKVNSIMPLVGDYIEAFWVNIFSSNQIQSKQPKPLIKQSSKIIDDEIFTVLSTQTHFCTEMTQLYNNQSSGTSFNRLAWNILGYGGPTLILIYLDKKLNNLPIIFGAYNPNPWSDGLKFQGDSGCYLFSISPSFRTYCTTGNGQNYAYLNTKNIDRSKYKVGLGFGGNSEHTSFRLWIDDEIENRSKVASEDDTYQPGYIAGEIEGSIGIVFIEVWGLGGKQALIQQDKYRQERMEELERMRKVDKKQFFSGFDQAMFFEKTFAHRDQVREEIEKD
ncbi:unnamed protein product [Paramecium octaurelia]|uniref:TLDc domain-containing protein n=1 Tax=Paramecium octaurelia TaxID=43137 RepID=A0A8S1VYV2_PAROT|nr:unnamed protein product [Paramecium octaurelia]